MPLLIPATRSVLRVLIGIHRLVWADERAAIPKPTLKASSVLLAWILCLVLLSGLASWLRAHAAGLGVVGTIVVAAGFAGIWLLISLRLPRRGVHWTALVPGALAFGLGLGVIQVSAVYFLAPYALAKQGTYGVLGVAAALLLGLFFAGRLIVAAAEMNATLRQRQARKGHAEAR